MNTVRLTYLAQGLAPQRKAVAVDSNDGSVITVDLECGHHVGINPHFYVKVGDSFRCHACGRIEALKLPEFAIDFNQPIERVKLSGVDLL